ncbi:hypothetical protein Gpo141_00012668 [Globisporangium polare]
MNASRLALLNAALFVVQAGVNVAYARYFVTLAREYETLIAPASFAFAIWILIYALEALLVLTDVFYPQRSLYADATQPTQLRTCFAITCIANSAWLILYVNHRVYAATVMIYILWLALLMLYIYLVNDRNARGTFDWRQYTCNELPITLYIAWVSALAFNHLAISLQHARGGFLLVSTYVVLLCIVITFAIVAVLYAKDAVFGIVAIWYLIAVAVKDVSIPSSVQCADMSARACAGEGAVIVSVLIVLSTLYTAMYDSEAPRPTAGGMAVVQGQAAPNYGSTA